MKHTYFISPAGIARIKKKMIRQFVPIFLFIALFGFVSWWFVLRPALHFDNTMRHIPGFVMLAIVPVITILYILKIRRAQRNLNDLSVNLDDLFVTSKNFLGTEFTIAYTDITSIEKIGDSYFLKTSDWKRFIELFPETENREQLLALIYKKRPDLKETA